MNEGSGDAHPDTFMINWVADSLTTFMLDGNLGTCSPFKRNCLEVTTEGITKVSRNHGHEFTQTLCLNGLTYLPT